MVRNALAHRGVIACWATALVIAGLAGIAPPAAIAPWSGSVGVTSSFGISGPGGCSLASTGTIGPAVAMASNATVQLTLSDSSTASGPTASDTGTVGSAVAGSVRVDESAGSLSDLDMTAHLTATAHRALGSASACSLTTLTTVSWNGTFSTASAGVLDLDVANIGSGYTTHTISLVRFSPGPVSGSLTTSIDELGHVHRLLSVPAGDWGLNVNLAAAATDTNSAGSPGPSTDVDVHLHGAFRAYGTAVGGPAGTGIKYLALPDSQSCATHSVTADFTAKAGKKAKHGKKPVIKKAIFFVDDVKTRTVKKPNKNTLVTLTGLPAQDDVNVSVQLKLTGKGTAVVERTYLPCP